MALSGGVLLVIMPFVPRGPHLSPPRAWQQLNPTSLFGPLPAPSSSILEAQQMLLPPLFLNWSRQLSQHPGTSGHRV